MVAALVRVSDKEENWILAEVVGWSISQNKYEVTSDSILYQYLNLGLFTNIFQF